MIDDHYQCSVAGSVKKPGDLRPGDSQWRQSKFNGKKVRSSLSDGNFSKLHLTRSRRLKRIIDIVVAIPLSLLFLPVIGVLIIAIKLIDPGPAFFVQRRVGIDGRIIPIYKIRSMYIDSEKLLEQHLHEDSAARDEWSRCCKLNDDPRVLSRLGNFIRRTSLDELPQFLNVICGDISLVGPRPFPPYHVARFDENFQKIRCSVPPGLTGLWQVRMRSNGNLKVQKASDLCYIENWSVWLDFYILLCTLPAILGRKGAR